MSNTDATIPDTIVDPPPAWTNRDSLALFLLTVISLLLNGFGLGALEFFRHTEADRALISWEMAESGDYLFPHLIHSLILTKPPLYYWLTAAFIHLFGSAEVWVVRLPSVCISALFVALQFFAVRRAGGSTRFAAFSALALLCSGAFFVLSTLAEIDMTFGFLCALTLYACYFGVVRQSLLNILGAYFFAGLAYLAKGPPAIFFLVAVHPLFFLHESYRLTGNVRPTVSQLFRLALAMLFGGLVFAAVILSWLGPIANAVGWHELLSQFRTEIVERVIEDRAHSRGYFFYVGAFFSSLLPWSIFLVAALLRYVTAKLNKKSVFFVNSDAARRFLSYNIIVTVVAVLMLSAAEGKSSRYLFPVHVFGLNICLFALLTLAETKWRTVFLKIGAALGVLLMIATVVIFQSAFVSSYWPTIDPASRMICSEAVKISAAVLSFYCFKKNTGKALLALCLVFVPVRMVLTLGFAPYRNIERTVRPLAAEVNSLLPSDAVLYHIENFDRWITFYLKHLGRETWRLTKEEAANPQAKDGRVFILLSKEDESWRLEQLNRFDPTTKVLKEFKEPSREYYLVETSAEILPQLSPHESFPTIPSKPYYNEPGKSS